MKKDNFDISKLSGSGYVIFPLSMSRLSTGQSPEIIYDFLKFLEPKIESISNDVVLLYTDGLYLNSDDKALDLRKKMINQMLNHKMGLLKLIYKEKKYVPKAFHFLPWDYSILSTENFHNAKTALIKASKNDERFKECLMNDLKIQGRESSDANNSFLIEETVITHLLTQKEIPLPHTLAPENGWRLICYPGEPISSWVYVYKNNLLPKKSFSDKQDNLFAHSLYNMDKRILIDFDVMDI